MRALLPTVKNQIIGSCAMSLELPPPVRSSSFIILLLGGLGGSPFAALLAPLPE